jgi:hypothetical protein
MIHLNSWCSKAFNWTLVIVYTDALPFDAIKLAAQLHADSHADEIQLLAAHRNL